MRDDLFDLACTLVTRRAVLKTALAATVGLLGGFGLLPKSLAIAAGCVCNGEQYDPLARCCLSSGAHSRFPLNPDVLIQYKGITDMPGYENVPTDPPCGAEGSFWKLPSVMFGGNFGPCCARHDKDWGECILGGRGAADTRFRTCLRASCPPASALGGLAERNACLVIARGAGVLVSGPLGDAAWVASKIQRCQGCTTPQCGQGVVCNNPGLLLCGSQ